VNVNIALGVDVVQGFPRDFARVVHVHDRGPPPDALCEHSAGHAQIAFISLSGHGRVLFESPPIIKL